MLTINVSRMETYECAAAMPWFFWTVSPVRPVLSVDSSTSRFAEAIPHEGTESDRDLLGSGSPSAGLKNRRTVSAAHMNSVLVQCYTQLTVKINRQILCVKFSWLMATTKIFYQRKFPDLRSTYMWLLRWSLQRGYSLIFGCTLILYTKRHQKYDSVTADSSV